MKTEIKKATIQQTKNGKLILHISLSQYDLDENCLEAGKQPKDLFKIVIHKSGEFTVRVVGNTEEACELVKVGFGYVT